MGRKMNDGVKKERDEDIHGKPIYVRKLSLKKGM